MFVLCPGTGSGHAGAAHHGLQGGNTVQVGQECRSRGPCGAPQARRLKGADAIYIYIYMHINCIYIYISAYKLHIYIYISAYKLYVFALYPCSKRKLIVCCSASLLDALLVLMRCRCACLAAAGG